MVMLLGLARRTANKSEKASLFYLPKSLIWSAHMEDFEAVRCPFPAAEQPGRNVRDDREGGVEIEIDVLVGARCCEDAQRHIQADVCAQAVSVTV